MTQLQSINNANGKPIAYSNKNFPEIKLAQSSKQSELTPDQIKAAQRVVDNKHFEVQKKLYPIVDRYFDQNYSKYLNSMAVDYVTKAYNASNMLSPLYEKTRRDAEKAGIDIKDSSNFKLLNKISEAMGYLIQAQVAASNVDDQDTYTKNHRREYYDRIFRNTSDLDQAMTEIQGMIKNR